MSNTYHFSLKMHDQNYEFDWQPDSDKNIISTDNLSNIPSIQAIFNQLPNQNDRSIQSIVEQLKVLPFVTDVTITKIATTTHQAGINHLLPDIAATATDAPSTIEAISSPKAIEKGEYLDTLLESMQDKYGFSGTVLIQENGETILEKGYGVAHLNDANRTDINTPIPIGSLTKPITSLAILKLIEDKRFVDPNTNEPIMDAANIKVIDFLPNDFKPNQDSPAYEKWADMTLQELMNHSAGLPRFDDKERELENSRVDGAPLSPKQIFDVIKEDPLDSKGSYRYSNFGYNLLGAIIEHVSPFKSYEEHMNHFLQDELGLTSTGYCTEETKTAEALSWWPDRGAESLDNLPPPSEAYAAGALYSTVQDLHALSKKLLQNEILSRDNTQKYLMEGVNGAHREEHNFRDSFTCSGGWNITTEPLIDDKGSSVHEIWKTGAVSGFGSIIVLYPEKNSSLIILSNQTTQGVNHEVIARELSKELLRTEKPRGSETEQLAKWEGVYTIPAWGQAFSITQMEGKFYFFETTLNKKTPLLSTEDPQKVTFEYGPPTQRSMHYLKIDNDEITLYDANEDIVEQVIKL